MNSNRKSHKRVKKKKKNTNVVPKRSQILLYSSFLPPIQTDYKVICHTLPTYNNYNKMCEIDCGAIIFAYLFGWNKLPN